MSTKTIRVSEKVIEFLQEKLKPLTGSSVSEVIEKELGLDESSKDVKEYWLVKSENVTQILAFENPQTALTVGEQRFSAGEASKIIAVREVRSEK